LTEYLEMPNQFGRKVTDTLELDTGFFGTGTIVLDDYQLVVDANIHDVFVKHMDDNILGLTRWLMEHKPKGLEGKVYQPDSKGEPLMFAVNVIAPDHYMPGKVRTRLRKELANNDRIVSYTETRVVDEVCSICGFRWIRELIMRSEMVNWVHQRDVQVRYNKSFPDRFTVSSKNVAMMMKLAYVDR